MNFEEIVKRISSHSIKWCWYEIEPSNVSGNAICQGRPFLALSAGVDDFYVGFFTFVLPCIQTHVSYARRFHALGNKKIKEPPGKAALTRGR